MIKHREAIILCPNVTHKQLNRNDAFEYSSHYEDFNKAYLHENYLSQKLADIKELPYRILDIFLITIYGMEK
jgi:hypothetical protein